MENETTYDHKDMNECLLCTRTPIEKLIEHASNLWDDRDAQKIAEKAARLIRSAYIMSPLDMCGKSPRGLMAAALYLSGIIEGERRIQSEIASELSVVVPTIRSKYLLLMKILDLNIPQQEKFWSNQLWLKFHAHERVNL